ncbi:MAG: NAD-dependent epimerase/dehydratase family protein [Candidatus Limiplasma sp.]|nr:NAD-dependent epimerase/dehydratase family protein [Candidatus Limiplasma sp.]
MNLLITGANGFMGKNLSQTLALRDDTLFLADVDTPEETLREAAAKADFVFHLAGVNRPQNDAEFQTGNADYTLTLLEMLKQGKCPPVLLSGSTQAALDNPYGISKRKAEEAVQAYAAATGAKVYCYRLTNAFGKWSKPNYNSAIATFCHHIARGLPITVSDPARVLRLVYIDDIVHAFIQAMEGQPTVGQDGFCTVRPEHEATLGQIVNMLEGFRDSRRTLTVPDQSEDFTRKLYATYQSFLPEDGFAFAPVTHEDARGSFTELLRLGQYGQVSVNISKPGICKGEHWHHTKHEKFIVVAGQGVIRFRSPFSSRVLSYHVSGAQLTVVDIPPGYTHNIENLGTTDLVTLMWSSETFDPLNPDTYRLPVEPQA